MVSIAQGRILNASSIKEQEAVFQLVWDIFINVSDAELAKLEDLQVDNIRQMLHAHEITVNNTDPFEVINGITFYYKDGELIMTDELIEEISQYDFHEGSYFF